MATAPQNLTPEMQQSQSDKFNAYIKANPNGNVPDEMTPYGDSTKFTVKNGVLTTQSALDQEASQSAGIASGALRNIGTADAPLTVPTGSAGATNYDQNIAPNVKSGVLNATGTAAGPNAPVNTSQPNPTNVNVQPGSAAVSGEMTDPNKSNLGPAPTGFIYKNSQGGLAPIPGAIQGLKDAGVPPPQDSGTASGQVSTAIQNSTPTSTPNPPAVDNFLNPQTNPALPQTVKQISDYLSSDATTKELNDQLARISADNKTLSGLKTDLMNIQNVMSGTEDDLRAEVTAANGFATESQILALAGARNKTLLKQANLIQQAVSTATDAVNNDTTLFTNEKDLANTQFTQRSGILQMAQTNYTNSTNAATNAANSIIKNVGYSGYVNSLLNSDPTGASIAKNEQLLGLQPGQLTQIATQEKSANNLAVIQASGATSPYVVTPAGEVWNTQTGYAYTSAQDFQQKTGKTLQTANIQKLPENIKTATEKAQLTKAQTDAQYAGAIDQANINQSNASAGSSAASAAKSNYDLNYEKANGGLTPADASKQGQSLLDDASGYIEKLGGGKIGWNDAWNALHTKYPDASVETLDNILQANNYRR